MAWAAEDERELASAIARVTWREPRLLARSPGEVRRALRAGRALVQREGGEPASFLLLHPYAGWMEVGSCYVAPAWRGQGRCEALHREAARWLDARCLPAFEFPSHPAVTRAARSSGFEPARARDLPRGVWARFLADRLRPRKVVSCARFVAAGAGRPPLHVRVLRR